MLRLQDIMTRNVVTVSPQLSLRDAMDLLTSKHISGAPVVVSGKVVGVISLTDLAELAAATLHMPTQNPEISEWPQNQDPVEWIDEDEPPAAYFAQLWEDSDANVFERMAETGGPEWNGLEEHTVGEAMSPKVLSLPPDALVEDAAAVMRRAGIHRLLVMEGLNLVGLVSTKDISDAVADHRFTSRVYVFGTPAAGRGR